MAGIWELYVYGQYMGAVCIWLVYGSYMCIASIWELYVYGRYMGAICVWPVYGTYMSMAGIWELYMYSQYMGAICIWPVYGSYMYMAGIWELYVYSQYMGAIWLQWSILTTHLYGDLQWTYKSLPYIPYKPHIGETVVPGKYLLVDTMHVHNR